MELKTKVNAEDDKQELVITREFDLPVELLFKAHEEPEIIEQWMSTKVLKQENKKYGCWLYESGDPKGTFTFRMGGVFHEFIPNKKITRTFQMDNSPWDAQLEFMEFEKLTATTSKLTIHIVYRSADDRDGMLKRGMGKGLSMAHDRLQNIVEKIK